MWGVGANNRSNRNHVSVVAERNATTIVSSPPNLYEQIVPINSFRLTLGDDIGVAEHDSVGKKGKVLGRRALTGGGGSHYEQEDQSINQY